MKTLPALLEPIKLAEQRILSQSDLINRSILALKVMNQEFKTHDGGGPIKAIQRRRAVAARNKLESLLTLADQYATYRCDRACAYTVGAVPDTGELAKLGFAYVRQLADYRDHVITAFSYDPETNRYDYCLGKKNWEWMTSELMVPVLKSYR